MFSPDETERAALLAEIQTRLEDSQERAWSLGVADGDNPQARALYGKLESIRAELDMIARRHAARRGWTAD